MKKLIYIMILGFVGIMGCQSHDHDDAVEQEIPTVAVTQWTEKMEIFMEYETALVDQEIKFIIHLTTMEDFQPVRDGKVTLQFRNANGTNIEIKKDKLLREGIFTPVTTFEKSGDYEFSLSYQGSKTAESFALGKFTVYSSKENFPVIVEETQGEEITFLKEQQWKMEFATEEAMSRVIKSAVHAVGEVRPQPKSYAEIVSPVEGLISIAKSNQLVNPGQTVRKGQTLAVLVPPLAAQNSWAEIYLGYKQANAEYERAKRLQDRNAISSREFEQAERDYEIQKAGFSNYFDSKSSNVRFDSQNKHFTITAPISGIVSDVTVLPGQHVARNQKLFSIVDPSIIRLRLELFASQAANLIDISGVSIRIPGNEKAIHLDKNKLVLISRGEVIDPQKRTVTLWLETDNRDRQFMIGQNFSAQIYSSPGTEKLTVPASAIFEDNARKIVIVQTGGESFENREITTGPEYFGFTALMSGLKFGERIVTQGGYLVKLASTTEEIGHPHTH